MSAQDSTRDPNEHLTPAWSTPPQPFRLHVARPGFWDSLEYRPLRRRPPLADEIEVEVTASALNFIDVMKAMGTYPGSETSAAQLGGECAGRVIAVGPGLSTLAVGDRVVACASGAVASHVTLRADHAQRIPDGMDDHTAAGLSLVLTTAWYGLHDLARLEPGESVLIHAASGGLGLAAIQVASALGARILATAGNEHKRSYLRTLGIADVFDSRDLSWVDGARAATRGRGVDVVLNSLTGAAIPLGLDALAEDGRFIEVGKQDIHAGRTVRLTAFKKGISLAAVDVGGLLERRPERFARVFASAWLRVRSGAFGPLPTKLYAFCDACDALCAMSRGHHVGKLVLAAPETVHNVAPEAMPHGRLRSGNAFRSQLEASPEAARHALAEAKVCELASVVLRLESAGINSETPFKALGLDSLVGRELRNRLEAAFGLQLSPMLLCTYGSARALAAVLCERVFATRHDNPKALTIC